MQRQITEFIVGKKNTLPGAFGVGLTNADCILTHTSATAGIDTSQREWCRAFIGTPALDTFVSHLYVSRDGRPSITQVRRFPSPDAHLTGLAGISVDLEFFSHWLNNVSVEPHGVISIFDTWLNLLASNNTAVGAPGQRVRNDTLQKFIDSSQDYMSVRTTALGDGTPRLYGIRKLANFPFLVVYGEADEDWQANWRRQVVVELGSFLLIAGMAIVMLRAYWTQLRQEVLLQSLANEDPLTGIANRRRFIERSGWELQKAKRSRQEMALLIIDIDRFKTINDTYGHAIGDKAIVLFSDACKRAVRETDLLGRFGGDEFVALLPATGSDEAVRIAERMRGLIASCTGLEANGKTIALSASIGVSTVHPDDLDLSRALHKADAALYRAKQGGRNRVELEGIARFEGDPVISKNGTMPH
jgi:diguanylate cyclase (GGDEF)-like protein